MNPGDVPYLDLDSTRSIAQKFVDPRTGAHPVAGIIPQTVQHTITHRTTPAQMMDLTLSASPTLPEFPFRLLLYLN